MKTEVQSKRLIPNAQGSSTMGLIVLSGAIAMVAAPTLSRVVQGTESRIVDDDRGTLVAGFWPPWAPKKTWFKVDNFQDHPGQDRGRRYTLDFQHYALKDQQLKIDAGKTSVVYDQSRTKLLEIDRTGQVVYLKGMTEAERRALRIAHAQLRASLKYSMGMLVGVGAAILASQTARAYQDRGVNLKFGGATIMGLASEATITAQIHTAWNNYEVVINDALRERGWPGVDFSGALDACVPVDPKFPDRHLDGDCWW